MNLKEDRRKEVEVLAKLAKVEISNGCRFVNLNKCFPYDNNCYNEPKHILYLLYRIGYPNPTPVASMIIAVCDEHLENYTWDHRLGWKEL